MAWQWLRPMPGSTQAGADARVNQLGFGGTHGVGQTGRQGAQTGRRGEAIIKGGCLAISTRFQHDFNVEQRRGPVWLGVE